MALRLLSTITLLHPYNGHILEIFLDVHAIFLVQHECATAQTGPHLQAVLFGLLDEGHGAHCSLLAMMFASLGLRVSSAYRPNTSEDGHPLCSLLALASVHMPSCLRAPSVTGPKVVSPTVAPRSLGPILGGTWHRSRGRHRRPEVPPFGLGAAMVAGEAQSVFTYKRVALLTREQIFHVHNR